MGSDATLTCIVNNYNRANFIPQCLHSIIRQKTDFLVDIVVVDDCSTDNSAEVVADIASQYAGIRLHYLSTPSNMGLGKSAIEALDLELQPFYQAPFICRIDSDDYLIDPLKFAKQVKTLQSHPDCVASCHRYVMREDESGLETVADGMPLGVYTAADLAALVGVMTVYTHASTYLYRNIHKSFMPPLFRDETWAVGDTLLNWAMLRSGNVHYSEDVMSVYRIHAGGIWSGLSEVEKQTANAELNAKILRVLGPHEKLIFANRVNCFIEQGTDGKRSLAKDGGEGNGSTSALPTSVDRRDK